MALVVVERVLDSVADFGELQRKEAAICFCLEARRVRLLRSFLALDRGHVVSLYEGPDAESVREVQRAAELPLEHAYRATAVLDVEVERPKGFVLAVAQRAFPEGMTLEEARYRATDPRGCRQRLRLHLFGAFLALDGRRLCCAYYAPDLESVRVANRESSLPFERLWAGELIRASG
jgi:uncharacterized protein DUF4242